ncbi:MAG: hypothetical protein H7282_05340 [Cytophagaceae bacterium]|nr:hypothetical protein [Cytophagaceae bacterium]
MNQENNTLFKNRTLLIATKHKKEQVLLPLFEKHLKVQCIVSENFNTDIFGTFSGEKERTDSPLETAKNKCLSALEQYKCELVISSEGSFGMHPYNIFCKADEEVLLFMDKKNNITISHCEISTQTNFNGKYIYSLEELSEFSRLCKFPSHALIMRSHCDDATDIVKGISTKAALFTHYKNFHSWYGKAFVETDMRAMHNPMRMQVIKKSAQKLIEKIISLCPQCATPGFCITNSIKGLICKLCGLPTRSTLAYEYHCQSCGWTKVKPYPYGEKEEPLYCDHCNP